MFIKMPHENCLSIKPLQIMRSAWYTRDYKKKTQTPTKHKQTPQQLKEPQNKQTKNELKLIF